MKREAQQFGWSHSARLCGAGIVSVLLAVLMGSQALAISPPELKVTTGEQSVYVNEMSSNITLDLVDEDGISISPLSRGHEVTITADSSSTTGEFFNNPDGTRESDNNNKFTFSSDEKEWSLYYKDSNFSTTEGYTLTFTMNGINNSVTQRITVQAPQLELGKPTLRTDTNQMSVKGTLHGMPEKAQVEIKLESADEQAIDGSSVELGDNGELEINFPEGIKDGNYSIELTVNGGEESNFIVSGEVTIASPPAPDPPESEPAPVPEPEQLPSEPDRPVVVEESPIKPVEPITKLALSSEFSAPLTPTSTSSQNFITATSRSSNGVAMTQTTDDGQDDIVAESVKGVKDSERSIELKTSADEVAPVEASEDGWRILGTPWYWWGSGVAATYGAWYGLRRLMAGGK